MTVKLSSDVRREMEKALEEYRARFLDLGNNLFQVFDYDRQKNQVSTQVRNLERVVFAHDFFGEIEDFVRRQAGKKGGGKWRRVASQTLDQIDLVRNTAAEIAKKAVKDASSRRDDLRLAVRRRLAEEWSRMVVGEYQYQKATDELSRETDGDDVGRTA